MSRIGKSRETGGRLAIPRAGEERLGVAVDGGWGSFLGGGLKIFGLSWGMVAGMVAQHCEYTKNHFRRYILPEVIYISVLKNVIKKSLEIWQLGHLRIGEDAGTRELHSVGGFSQNPGLCCLSIRSLCSFPQHGPTGAHGVPAGHVQTWDGKTPRTWSPGPGGAAPPCGSGSPG